MDGNKALECLKEMTEEERKAVRIVLWRDENHLDCLKKSQNGDTADGQFGAVDINHYTSSEKGRYQEFMKSKLAWMETYLGNCFIAVDNAEFIENLGWDCWGGIGFKCGDSWPRQDDVKRHLTFYIGYNLPDYNGDDCNWYIGCCDDVDGEFDSNEFMTFKEAADGLVKMIGQYIALPKD